ncbi:spore germination protein, partial [Eubacterium sp.]|uniref:spore germination protein n=1 Tax=Eubacterium sp. TaxID=142586 RepID=UPI00402A2778
MNIYDDYELNRLTLEDDFKDSSDFLLKEIITGNNKALVCGMDGLIDSLQLSQMIMKPLLECKKSFDSYAQQLEYIKTEAVHCIEQKSVKTFEDAYYFLSSGFAVVIIDGIGEALAFGIQGWTRRDTSEAKTEANVKGAKECFVESINDNKALLRKRLKTYHLKQKQIKLGSSVSTPVALCYLDNRADKSTVKAVEQRLKDADLSTVSDYGELSAFLDSNIKSFFTAVGNTERPDVLASKLLEGRVAVMVEGSPFVIYVPYLFSDNFSAADDYDNQPIFSGFMRLLRYFSFVVSLLLTALFVAVGQYHHELITTNLFFLIGS